MYKMGLLGKKVGMTQVYNENGERVSVTVVVTGPCMVLGKRTPDKDGYTALQLGFDDQKPSRVKRPDMGRFEKANSGPKRFVKEVRLEAGAADAYEVGQEIKVDEVFAAGDMIDVSGVSVGKGFQGVMKKYHFKGTRATHGSHEYFRHGGSIGCRLTPGRVVKGKKMPGQMGNYNVTVQNQPIVEVRPEDNALLIRGNVPGSKNAYCVMRYAKKLALPERVSA